METFLSFIGLVLAILGGGLGFFGDFLGLSPVFSLLGWLLVPIGLVVLVLGLGLVVISERQVGIIVKKFGGRSLPPGQFIALNGEAGYQADTLAPGWHSATGRGNTPSSKRRSSSCRRARSR